MAMEGNEDGVLWKWVNNLELSAGGVGEELHAAGIHELHKRSVASMGGNTFYGSFSFISGAGQYYMHKPVIEAHPTQSEHTEPQYFTWLAKEIAGLTGAPLLLLASAEVFILEINQTNTPCSKKTCRKAILEAVKSKTVCGNAFDMVIARMSAYQIYESQYPKVYPTSFEIKDARKAALQTCAVQSMCLHRIPEIG